MLLAGACFLAGVVLCAAACALGMLITGRILLGFGVGFANQACTPSGFLSVLAWFHVAGGGVMGRNLREGMDVLCGLHDWPDTIGFQF